MSASEDPRLDRSGRPSASGWTPGLVILQGSHPRMYQQLIKAVLRAEGDEISPRIRRCYCFSKILTDLFIN